MARCESLFLLESDEEILDDIMVVEDDGDDNQFDVRWSD